MTINYTTLLGLAQPVTGTEQGVWGTVVNDEITALIEAAIANGTSINVTAGNVTLTTTTGAANQARNAILIITGTPGTSRNVVAPSTSKVYVVINGSDSSVVIKGAATTGVTIAAGAKSLVAWNGSDFVEIGQAGDMDGPTSSTDNAAVRFDGTSGKLVQNSGVIIDDSNNVTGVAQITATTLKSTNLQTTNLKANDGTAAGSIADSTGIISISSNPILSGGTANGVLYLNGSKSATSGSAITFDGTNFATTGTASATKLIPTGGAVTGNGMYLPAANAVAITTNGANAIYIDSSQNVGIGTNSPGNKLHVNASGDSARFQGTSRSLYIAADTNASAIWNGASQTGEGVYLNAASNQLDLYTSSITRLRIDSSGNVGIGVTPSAWGSTYKAEQIGQAGVLAGHGSVPAFTLASNAYENSGWKAITTNPAQRIDLSSDNNATIFYRAASATAGTALSWSESMRIDSSGNVGIGTTSPGSKLEVAGSTVRLTNSSAGNTALQITASGQTAGSSSFDLINDASFAYVYNRANTPLVFGTNNTERARITSGGQFLVGATSASTPTNSTSYIVSQGDFSSVGGVGFGMSVASTTGTGEDHYYISFQTATTTQRGYIYYNNGAGQVQLSATSDARLKENIVEAPSALPVLEQVKVRQYDWKETGNTNIGFVAQELHEVIPRAVAVGQDNEDGTIKMAWGVDNASLVPYLVKAIQELKAITDAQATRIEALEAEVAAMKGN